jgi:hypothetical protein
MGGTSTCGLIGAAGIVTISLNRSGTPRDPKDRVGTPCATGGRLIKEGEPCVRGRELEKGAFPGGG